MCDPVTAITIGGAVASAAGSLFESSQAASGIAATRDAQNKANADWVAYQNKIHRDQALAEQEARGKATQSQQDTLGKIGPDAQKAAQTAEQQRLNSLYTKPGASEASNPTDAKNLLLSGERTGNQTFMGDLTRQVTNATAAARQRIAALATAGSYGGSFGGLGTTVPITLAQGGNDITLQNAMRQGNLKTYGVEQQVQPVNYTVGPGTLEQQGTGKALGSLAGTLAGIGGPKLLGASGVGSGFGNLFGGSPNVDWGGLDDQTLSAMGFGSAA
jgi:hypothetical protein